MNYSKDYEIIVEKKYFAIFTDGEGKEQKVEIEEDVASELIRSQRKEKADNRYNERHTISLDLLDYEGEVFATYDDYQTEKEDLSLEEKVEIVLRRMKPEQAHLLYKLFFFE